MPVTLEIEGADAAPAACRGQGSMNVRALTDHLPSAMRRLGVDRWIGILMMFGLGVVGLLTRVW